MTLSNYSHADIAEALVPYGWTTLVVLHLTSCCLHAHTMGLGMKTVYILRMWLCLAVLVHVSDYIFIAVNPVQFHN